VLKEEPDLVTASFGYALNGEDPDRRAQYAKLGVPTYVAPSHCDGRTDESGDGPRDHPLEMDVIYDEITQLAEIFDVPSRGAKLVAELKQRMTDAAASVPANDISIAYWFANTELPYMAGANGAPGLMSRTAGNRRSMSSGVRWAVGSWVWLSTTVTRPPCSAMGAPSGTGMTGSLQHGRDGQGEPFTTSPSKAVPEDKSKVPVFSLLTARNIRADRGQGVVPRRFTSSNQKGTSL
jgi:hypothetical protein